MMACPCADPAAHAARLPGRRGLFGLAVAAALTCEPGGFLPFGARPARAAEPVAPVMTPEEALRMMREGNERYLVDAPFRAASDRGRRLEIARGQRPFCVLVGCSDSRVSPELLFGRGLGELFIVRNAGNVVDLAAMGSIEYGVAALGVPLVVVLGHQRCGAVDAAVSIVEKDERYPGSIGKMVEPIVPAVLTARRRREAEKLDAPLLDLAVRENVARVVERLRTTEQLMVEPQRKGTLRIVGAYYDLDSGRVEFSA